MIGGSLSGSGGSAPRRVYETVSVEEIDGGWRVLLDGKPLRTPARTPLLLPSEAVADAVAGEWRAQGPRIDPRTMPLTRLANSTIDGVRGHEAAVRIDMAKYAASDLICYRAEGPEALVARQREAWDPVLAFAHERIGLPFLLAEGIVHVTQPEASVEAYRDTIEDYGDFQLAALHLMTTLMGSALLALAVALGRLSPDEAWQAAHIDEDFEIGQWGEDAEATQRRTDRKRDFDAAVQLFQLLGSTRGRRA